MGFSFFTGSWCPLPGRPFNCRDGDGSLDDMLVWDKGSRSKVRKADNRLIIDLGSLGFLTLLGLLLIVGLSLTWMSVSLKFAAILFYPSLTRRLN